MRLAAAFVILAATAAAMSSPTFSAFTGDVEANVALGTDDSFVPTITTAPAFTGAIAGLAELQVTPGMWRVNVPTTRSYVWQACTNLAATSCLTLGTGTSIVLPTVLPNPFIRVVETLTTVNFGAPTAASVPRSS